MGYLDGYKRRATINGKTIKEKYIKLNQLDFQRALKELPNYQYIPITSPNSYNISKETHLVDCTIQDVGFNDRRFYDEKQLCVLPNSDVGVGCYAEWDSKTWLTVFQEHIGIPSHKCFIMRPCNNIFCFKGENSEIIITPVIVSNLTLYSHGLDIDRYLETLNGKRSIMVGRSEITDNFKIGQRLMINHNSIFRITHIDDFTYEGLVTLTVLQTQFTAYDNKDLNIADYYKPTNDKSKNGKHQVDNIFNDVDNISSLNVIEGDDSIAIGTSSIYQFVSNENKTARWKLEFEDSKPCATIENLGDNLCKIKVVSEGKFVDKKIILKACDDDYSVDVLAEKTIIIESLI